MEPKKRPHIVVAEPLQPAVLQRLRDIGTVSELSDSSPQSLIQALREADALVVRMRSHVTARVIDAAPQLRVIGRAGASLDHIDIRAAERRNIKVVYTPTAQVSATADFTITLILASARRLLWYDRRIREGLFDQLRAPYGCEIQNMTLGLLGGGSVADRVSQVFRNGWNSRVICHTPDGVEGLSSDTPQVDLETLLSECDVLSIHMPLTQSFIGMIDSKAIDRMKPTACIVNTSRGAIIDNFALAEALKTKRIAGAAMDVFDAEPLPAAHPLRNAPNCILTPHVSAHTSDIGDRYAMVADDIIRVLRGESPEYPAPSPDS